MHENSTYKISASYVVGGAIAIHYYHYGKLLFTIKVGLGDDANQEVIFNVYRRAEITISA